MAETSNPTTPKANPAPEAPAAPEAPLTQMIRAVTPHLQLSGDINKIFDEIHSPKISYEFTVVLSFKQIVPLVAFLADHDVLALAEQTIQGGGSVVPAQLILEFLKTIERMKDRLA